MTAAALRREDPMPMTNKVVIELDVPMSIPPDLLADKTIWRDGLAVTLYRQGKLTMRQTTELMGITRREFEDRLPEFGISMMDVEDLPHEITAADALFRRTE
jgi:predicted HTH domain antitoxin